MTDSLSDATLNLTPVDDIIFSNSFDCGYGNIPIKPKNLQAPSVGNPVDVCGNLNAGNGATLLMGGGADVDVAFSNRVTNHVGSGMDVVVLRTSGNDGYNSYLQNLMNADSVTTLVIDTQVKLTKPIQTGQYAVQNLFGLQEVIRVIISTSGLVP
ncbi:MAG: hypothetical protein AB8B80_04295 [Marinicellaceae bacterium]